MPSVALTAPPSDILFPDEAAELLGTTVRTLQRWRKLPRRRLEAHRVPGGRRVYFLRSEILAWLKGHRDLPLVSSPRSTKKRA